MTGFLGFLAVNGSLFVLLALIVLSLAVCVADQCSFHPFRSIEAFFTAVTSQQAARRRTFEKKAVAKASLNGKSILMVHDEPGVLKMLAEEIRNAYPGCRLQKAITYGEATTLMGSWTYDLVILDIMGDRGFDVLMQAVNRPYPVPSVMLNAHALSPESLKKAIALGVYAYLPQGHPGIVPFLADVMTFEYEAAWRCLLQQVRRRVSLLFRFTEGGNFRVATR
ncbi:MAG: response regulator [Syntrophorhabdales bacterium]|jgi:CheY-like chemotaxis protein